MKESEEKALKSVGDSHELRYDSRTSRNGQMQTVNGACLLIFMEVHDVIGAILIGAME